jgi:mannosyltransferase OCH1-like enzyme
MIKFMKREFKTWVILDAYSNAKFGVMQADIFRYCFAFKNGGVYVDLTKFFSKSLTQIFFESDSEFVVSYERNQRLTSNGEMQQLIANWSFAVEPHSPIMLEVIRHIEGNFLRTRRVIFEDIGKAVLTNTGTEAFSEGFRNGLAKNPKSKITIKGTDFQEDLWPKFESARYLNVFSKHYTLQNNSIIFD